MVSYTDGSSIYLRTQGMYSSMDATYYDMYAEGKYPLGDAIY